MVEGVYTLPVMRTLQAGGVPAMELLALLGKPLDSAEREKALGIVRQNGGVASAFATAQAWAKRAEVDLRRAAGVDGDRLLCAPLLGPTSSRSVDRPT